MTTHAVQHDLEKADARPEGRKSAVHAPALEEESPCSEGSADLLHSER